MLAKSFELCVVVDDDGDILLSARHRSNMLLPRPSKRPNKRRKLTFSWMRNRGTLTRRRSDSLVSVRDSNIIQESFKRGRGMAVEGVVQAEARLSGTEGLQYLYQTARSYQRFD